MTHEVFQNLPLLGAYSGISSPFGLTNPALQAFGINPAIAFNPQITGGLQNPQTSVLQNPLLAASLQNPVLAACLHNPALAATLQNPIMGGIQNPLQQGHQQYSPWSQLGVFGSPYGQIGSPFSQFGQTGSPFGQLGSPYAQMGSPFSQFGSPFGQTGSPYGQFGSPYSQIGSPFGQIGSQYGQFGSPLAPQTWMGQGQPFGQINPLAAYAALRLHTPGVSPWTSSPWASSPMGAC